MADEHDPKLSRHYRELEPLEPPAALDLRILAAARQATESHAPLVAPAGRHRWHYSLAAAAVLVFAVALTLHLDRDRPDQEAMYAPSVRGEIKQAPKAEAKAEAPPPRAEAQRSPAFAPDPRESAPRAVERARAPAPREQPELAAARAQADEARGAQERAATAKQQQAASRLAAASSAAPAQVAPENPERWLERIAELRSRGRHAEADRELVAFRKAYPNYQLSNVMRERVEGTPTPSP